jgi:hypothetical protein
MKGFVLATVKPRRTSDKKVRMTQIAVAPWQGDKGMTYSILALSEDGAVYRYDAKCTGWIPWNMCEAECANDHHR